MSETGAPRPLDALGTLKVKLGTLVGCSVLIAVVMGLVGSAARVPALLVIPVTVAVALGVTQLLAAGMISPLRQMTDVAGAMARGDYSGRVRTQARDEVGRLAAAFNAMADDLAAVDHERRDLIATVSHELRTPLTAMTAQLENLADGVVPADAAHLGEALAQAERLGRLVSDLLELSRLDAGVVAPDWRAVDVAALVEECVSEVVATGREAAYVVDVPRTLEVQADPLRLRQLLVNVLDNAGRHAPAGTSIHVTARVKGERWRLDVADAGAGVPADRRERVFERFGTDATGGGTGLGLAVARWVAQLHGGTIRFVEPVSGVGATVRLDLPRDPRPLFPAPRPVLASEEIAMPTSAQPTAAPSAPPPAPAPTPGGLDQLFGSFWREPPGLRSLGTVAAAAAVGIAAALLMEFPYAGLGWTMVLWLAGGTAYAASVRRREPFTIACTALSALLTLGLTVRAAEGLPVLATLAAAAVFLIGLTGGRSLLGFVLTGVSWPLAALRGLPWFGRSARLFGTGGRTPAVVRTAALSVLGLLVFGALFASADPLFASWVDAVVPNWTFGTFVGRTFLACAVFGLTLAAAYLALNPSRVELDLDAPAPLRNRWEWLVPVVVVDLVFIGFLAAQATVVFGGHAYLERTTGITYADYVHQGFGQLTVATALTLLVVGLAARRAAPEDGHWLRGSLGLLCVLTLVVVASALYRMHVYQQAYGFTVLRLVVDVFEGWLGLVVVAVMVVGGLGRGRSLPRIALLTGGVAVLGLLVVNPDAWVAQRNLDRYDDTGLLDASYLAELSPDATPVIADRLPPDVAACVLRYQPLNQLDPALTGGWRSWNLGRARGADALATLPANEEMSSATDPCTVVLAPFEVPAGAGLG